MSFFITLMHFVGWGFISHQNAHAQESLQSTCVKAELQSFLSKYDIDSDWKSKITREEIDQLDQSILDGFSLGTPIKSSPSETGLHFYVRGSSKELESYETKPVTSSGFPYSEFLGESWKWKGTDFRFLNVGSKQFQKDASAIAARVHEGLRKGPGRDIIVPISSRWRRGFATISGWQRWVSNRVTDVYAERKPYLSGSDLFNLRFTDILPWGSNDYFVLLRDPKKSTLEMSPGDFEANALVVVRLARMDMHVPAFPRKLFPANTAIDSLPHSKRVSDDSRQKILDSLQALQRFKGKKVAEISRFVKFQETPEPVMDALLKNLFQLAKDPKDPIDLFVISVDKFTRRLFGRRYRFRDLATITPAGSDSPEYLMYLDTHEANFADTLSDLANSSKEVFQTPVTSFPNESSWSNPWGFPPNFFNHNESMSKPSPSKVDDAHVSK